MKSFTITLALALLALGVIAHPTKYHHGDRNVSCYEPEPAKIYSWHIHLLFWQDKNESLSGALKVRDAFSLKFANLLGKNCTDLFHQDYNCMFDIEAYPAGPFPIGQWSVFLLPEHFGTFVPWIVQNRNGYDVLVHPNSGCEVEDHTWWAMWNGNPWQLDVSIMGHDQPFPWPEDLVSVKEHQQQAEEQSDLIRIFNSLKKH